MSFYIVVLIFHFEIQIKIYYNETKRVVLGLNHKFYVKENVMFYVFNVGCFHKHI